MNSVVKYRGREVVIYPFVDCGYCGGFVDEFLRRLGNVETDVKELRTDVSELKVGMEALRGDVKAISAVIPHLATKADLGQVKTEIAAVRGELASGIAAVRGELATGITAVRGEMATGMESVKAKIASMESTMTKWMIALVLAVVGAAKFLH